MTCIYGSGKLQYTRVAAISPLTGQLEEKQVQWFKTDFSRHVVLAHKECDLGDAINPCAFWRRTLALALTPSLTPSRTPSRTPNQVGLLTATLLAQGRLRACQPQVLRAAGKWVKVRKGVRWSFVSERLPVTVSTLELVTNVPPHARRCRRCCSRVTCA